MLHPFPAKPHSSRANPVYHLQYKITLPPKMGWQGCFLTIKPIIHRAKLFESYNTTHIFNKMHSITHNNTSNATLLRLK